jgi:hypothetical protein
MLPGLRVSVLGLRHGICCALLGLGRLRGLLFMGLVAGRICFVIVLPRRMPIWSGLARLFGILGFNEL